jgi:hypothetical protein
LIPIPDLGSKGQKGTGSWILDPGWIRNTGLYYTGLECRNFKRHNNPSILFLFASKNFVNEPTTTQSLSHIIFIKDTSDSNPGLMLCPRL